ncbi:MAG: hypothetical protein ABWY25_02595 [Paenisporosarcina sp.]
MREVNVLNLPDFYPNVCIRCGIGSPQRIYYIDLGLNLDFYFNPKQEGNIYFCNECWESLVTSVSDKIQLHLHDTFPWQGQGYIKPTYDDTEVLIERRSETTRSLSDGTITTFNPITTIDDSVPNFGDPDSDGSAETIEPAVLDDEDESVRDFRGFFGQRTE